MLPKETCENGARVRNCPRTPAPSECALPQKNVRQHMSHSLRGGGDTQLFRLLELRLRFLDFRLSPSPQLASLKQALSENQQVPSAKARTRPLQQTLAGPSAARVRRTPCPLLKS